MVGCFFAVHFLSHSFLTGELPRAMRASQKVTVSKGSVQFVTLVTDWTPPVVHADLAPI